MSREEKLSELARLGNSEIGNERECEFEFNNKLFKVVEEETFSYDGGHYR